MLRVAAGLAHGLDESARPMLIAHTIVSTWREIDAALRPVIGQRGVAALYRRALYLTAAEHGWLSDVDAGVPATMDLDALRTRVASRTSADAVAGSVALLKAFTVLMGSLVGDALTERLLAPVTGRPQGGTPAEETST